MRRFGSAASAAASAAVAAAAAWALALALGPASCSSAPASSSDAAADAPSSDGSGGDAGATGIANGTLGLWQTLAPMPVARANFCATVAIAGDTVFIVAIGGNFPDEGGFTKLDAIHVARFHADGTLDAWQLAGHPPSPVTECTAAAAGSTLYLLDGIYDDNAKAGIVFSADLDAAGTLGAWTQLSALPNLDRLLDDVAFTTADRLVALTSKLSGSCAAVSAPVASLASAASWTDADFFSEFRGRPQWAHVLVAGTHYGYVLGGYSDADSGNQVLATGQGAALGPDTGGDGTTGTPFDVTPLPQPTTFGTAASADDWVFIIGGRDAIFAGTPRTTILSARADATAGGALGAWSAQAPLPSPRTNVVAVVAGNFLYVLGGANAQATDTVFAAQVRF